MLVVKPKTNPNISSGTLNLVHKFDKTILSLSPTKYRAIAVINNKKIYKTTLLVFPLTLAASASIILDISLSSFFRYNLWTLEFI